jgi:hypothetical protein
LLDADFRLRWRASKSQASEGHRAMQRIHLLLQCGCFILAPAFVFAEAAHAQDEQGKAAQELIEPFKGKPGEQIPWQYWGADAMKYVAFEPTGMRITLPAGQPKGRQNTGVSMNVTVKGDFDITVSYEVLQEPAPADAGANGTAFTLVLMQKQTPFQAAGLSRKVGKDGRVASDVFFRSYFQDDVRQQGTKGNVDAAEAKSGRLQMVRTGPVLSYFAADGPDAKFKHLRDIPIGTDDIKAIRLVGNVGGPKAALDVRIADLHVRTRPEAPDAGAPGKPAVLDGPGNPGGSWLIGLLLAGVGLIVCLSLAGGVVYFMRNRRAEETPADAEEAPADGNPQPTSLLATCPGCGKNIKVKSDLAGRKVKCPKCATPVPVPR